MINNINLSTNPTSRKSGVQGATHIRRRSLAAFLTLCFLFTGNPPSAQAQLTEHWRHEEREASQKLCSAALNLLVKQHETKKGSKPVKGKGSSIDQAIVILNKAIIKDPTDPLPHYLLGISLGIIGKYEEALD
ncbi:MAG: hypothetical protein K2Z81_26660, partial [Cyanobacteria bacterium]|nr:hypothetical protein [Cyanobacteriota bacterium]